MPENLLPTHTEKTLRAMKAPRAVKRITFDRNEARTGETLYVSVPKLHENEVLVPGSLASSLTSTFLEGTPTKSFKTFSFRRNKETTGSSKGFRVRNYARSAQARETRKPRASTLKKR